MAQSFMLKSNIGHNHLETETKETEKAEIQLHAVLLNAAEGGYVSMNPETGTFSQGDTVDKAISNLREATELYLEACPSERPQGETVGTGIVKPMTISVDESVLADE